MNADMVPDESIIDDISDDSDEQEYQIDFAEGMRNKTNGKVK